MAIAETRLIDRLPKVRGRLTEGSLLSAVTWFRVGGPAEVLFKPADVEDLAQFLKQKPDDVTVTVIGVGSNLLVRDGGIDGVVIRLGRGFTEIRANGSTIACRRRRARPQRRPGGARCRHRRARVPVRHPGHHRRRAAHECRRLWNPMSPQVFQHADALDAKGELHRLGAIEMGFTYRHSAVPEDWIFVGGAFAGRADDPKAIHARIQEIQTKREESQPIRARTGGSTFVNPTATRPGS